MKPKIFVSSTIIDFEDLRSSIKYYLEDFGYDVQMSEYPNFDVNPDYNAFDTCLNNLIGCQYFILLIGYRRGSWFKENELSITHLEYRAAKSLIERGNPLRVIAFVRKPIWLLKNDRVALIKHFADKSESLSEELKKVGSNVIDDPEYIFDFLQEVKSGIKFSGSELPSNNWIYDFQSFEDIITALKHTFKITESLQEKKLKKLLIIELDRNRNRFMIPKKGVKVEDYPNIKDLPQENILESIARKFFPRLFDEEGNPLIGKKDLIISGDEVGFLLVYITIFPMQKGLRDLKIQILERAILDGIFLDFDVYSDDFNPNYLTFAMEKLLEWIKVFRNIFDTEFQKEFQKELARISTDGSAYLSNIKLSMYSAGFILGMADGVRIQGLIDCILDVLKNNNYQSLLEFDFSDKFYIKYLKKEE